MVRGRALAPVALAALLVLAAACSDDSDRWRLPFGTPAGEPVTPAPPPVRPTPTPTPTPVCADPLGCYEDPVRAGRFDAALVPQASGLAASRRNPGVLYLLDDQPGTAEIWAVRTDGELIAELPIAGLDALDTESLAIGPCGAEGGHCLYVADIGDNLRSREHIEIHRVAEPDLSEGSPGGPLPADTIRLAYPDHPEDAEALLVDADGTPHVVTKARYDLERRHTEPTRVLAAPGFADGVLVEVARFDLPPPRRALATLFFGDVVTGGEALPGRVLLRSYDHVVEFVAPDPAAPLRTFPTWTAREVPSPWQPQAEAVTYAADGCGFYAVSELVGDIWFTPCLP